MCHSFYKAKRMYDGDAVAIDYIIGHGGIIIERNCLNIYVSCQGVAVRTSYQIVDEVWGWKQGVGSGNKGKIGTGKMKERESRPSNKE